LTRPDRVSAFLNLKRIFHLFVELTIILVLEFFTIQLAKEVFMQALLQAFNEGGIFMYFILGFFIVSAIFLVERYIYLYLKYKETPNDFRKRVLEYWAKGDYKGAEDYAQMTHTNLGSIVVVASKVKSAGAGVEELQARMDEQLNAEISILDRRTGFLAMFGNVATLIGLLGTIAGMIHSFGAVAKASPMDRATLLSKGISEAMNCTAFGLIVAVPALVMFAVYQNRTDKLIQQLTHKTTELYHDFVFMFGKK
jgi:biopolymer transport protein ExbB